MRPSDAVSLRAPCQSFWRNPGYMCLLSVPWSAALPCAGGGDQARPAGGRLVPAKVGAGHHSAPWGSSEVSLVASRLSSHAQCPGNGEEAEEGSGIVKGKRREKAACRGLRSQGEQDPVWGQRGKGEESKELVLERAVPSPHH